MKYHFARNSFLLWTYFFTPTSVMFSTASSWHTLTLVPDCHFPSKAGHLCNLKDPSLAQAYLPSHLHLLGLEGCQLVHTQGFVPPIWWTLEAPLRLVFVVGLLNVVCLMRLDWLGFRPQEFGRRGNGCRRMSWSERTGHFWHQSLNFVDLSSWCLKARRLLKS